MSSRRLFAAACAGLLTLAVCYPALGGDTAEEFWPELNAFVKLLREHHRLFHGKTEFARSFLLQFGRDERRNRIALPFLRGYIVDDERLFLGFGDDLTRFSLVID